MPVKKIAAGIQLATVSATAIVVLGAPAHAAGPAWTKNCTALNQKYPHGVGRAKAHDHTSGHPVTTFVHSDKLYKQATGFNGRLDGDGDGIACEKA